MNTSFNLAKTCYFLFLGHFCQNTARISLLFLYPLCIEGNKQKQSHPSSCVSTFHHGRVQSTSTFPQFLLTEPLPQWRSVLVSSSDKMLIHHLLTHSTVKHQHLTEEMLHATPNGHLREECSGFSGNADTDQS